MIELIARPCNQLVDRTVHKHLDIWDWTENSLTVSQNIYNIRALLCGNYCVRLSDRSKPNSGLYNNLFRLYVYRSMNISHREISDNISRWKSLQTDIHLENYYKSAGKVTSFCFCSRLISSQYTWCSMAWITGSLGF